MNVVVAVCLIGAIATVGYTEYRLHQIRKVKVHQLVPVGHSGQSQTAAPTPAGPPMTFLIVGSDSRAALAGPDNAQFGGAAATPGARSDTIILARLVPATKQVELLSIPRDLYVHIPGLGMQRINAAINQSPDLLIQVIKQLLNVDVNHYIDIDFDSFRDISNAVGGVEVYFPTKAKDAFSGLNIPAPGCYSLQGDQALSFVRSRDYQYFLDGSYHDEALSDLARIQRQQIFIRGLVKKAESVGLTNPLTLNSVIGGVTKNLTVDSSLSTGTMINLARTFRSIDAASIPGITLPTTPETLSSGAEILQPETAPDNAVVRQFLAFGSTAATPPATTSPARSPSGTAGPTTTTAPVVTLPPSLVTVEVRNGSGVAGQATGTAGELRRAGFAVSSISSSSSYGVATTTIEYGAGGLEAARTVAGDVGGGAALEQVAGLGSSTVVLVTGQSLTAIGAGLGSTSGSGGSTASSTSSTSSTTVPATTSTTTYELPGTPAGSTPPTCGS